MGRLDIRFTGSDEKNDGIFRPALAELPQSAVNG